MIDYALRIGWILVGFGQATRRVDDEDEVAGLDVDHDYTARMQDRTRKAEAAFCEAAARVAAGRLE